MQRLTEIASMEVRRVVGMISGTSADGIDAVLAELRGCGADTRFAVLAFETVELPAALRREVFALFGSDARVEDLCRVNFALGEAFARAALGVIAAAGLKPEEVALIGSHGQTVRHLPRGEPPSTLQIGEPAVIARRTGITTIADFRPADVAAGGQGAPLVPLVDHLLFTHPEELVVPLPRDVIHPLPMHEKTGRNQDRIRNRPTAILASFPAQKQRVEQHHQVGDHVRQEARAI